MRTCVQKGLQNSWQNPWRKPVRKTRAGINKNRLQLGRKRSQAQPSYTRWTATSVARCNFFAALESLYGRNGQLQTDQILLQHAHHTRRTALLAC